MMESSRVRLNLRGFKQGYDPENAKKTFGNYSRRAIAGGVVPLLGAEEHPLLKWATSGAPALPSLDQEMNSMVIRSRSEIGFLGVRRNVPGPPIEPRAFFAQYAAFDGNVVAIGLRDKIKRVDVAGLEIKPVYILASRAVDDASDLRPNERHRAHPARLQGRVDGRPAQFAILPPLAGRAQGFDFGVSGDVAFIRNMVSLACDDLAVEDDDATDRREAGIATAFRRDPQGLAHEIRVVFTHLAPTDSGKWTGGRRVKFR